MKILTAHMPGGGGLDEPTYTRHWAPPIRRAVLKKPRDGPLSAGIVSLAVLWLTEGQTGWIVMFAAITVAAIVPVALSYCAWRAR